MRGIALALLLAACGRAETNLPVSLVAFGSCAHQSKAQDFWAPILALKPQVFIFAGDNIYADTLDMAVLRQKYGMLASQPGFQALRSNTSVLATWDDHDYGVDDAGSNYACRAGSQAAFCEFWNDPPDAPRRSRPGVYASYLYGPPGRRLQIILLDTRYFRGPLKRGDMPDAGGGPYVPRWDPEIPLLGEEQWAWLEGELKRPAEVRLIVSSIQFVAEEHGWEKWGNLPLERERMLEMIGRTGASGVIFLSGDRHHGELSCLRGNEAGYPIYDLTASGLNQARGKRALEERNSLRVGPVVPSNHYGVVRIAWTNEPVTVRLEIHDLAGRPVLEHGMPLSELRADPAKRLAPAPPVN